MTPASSKPTSSFRHDINGLRAIAVTIVVLFHFHVPYFDGGYVGVDVFFVISGYLMTSIIYRALEQGDLSVFGFYYARFKRISPALVAMLIAVALVLHFAVDPLTASANTSYLALAALFYTNIIFAFKSSYFASSSEANWLLHTWSLSVEWQFYMVFPLGAALIYRLAPSLKFAFYAVLIATLLSFGLTMVMSSLSSILIQQSFFQFPTRCWEMLMGGLVALFPVKLPNRLRPALEITGLILIVGSVALLSAQSLWPSPMTLLPVLGTALILLANMKNRLWHSNAITGYLGSRSYSLYLWHWPIVVGQAYFGFASQDAPLFLLCGVLLSGFCAELSYRFVERPSARVLQVVKPLFKPLVVAAVVALPVVVGGRFEALERASLLPQTLSQNQRTIAEDYLAASKDWLGFRACPTERFEGPYWQNLNTCRIAGTGVGRLAVVGDSFSEQFIPRLRETKEWGAIDVFYAPGCPPFDGIERTSETYKCQRSTNRIQNNLLTGDYDRVVIISAITQYFDANAQITCLAPACVLLAHAEPPELESFVASAAEFWARYAKTGVDLRFVGPFFRSDKTARDLYLEAVAQPEATTIPSIPAPDARKAQKPVSDLAQRIAKDGQMAYVDPLVYQCPEVCAYYLDGAFVFKDDYHFRASLVTGPLFDWMDAQLFEPLNTAAGEK